MVVPLSQSFDHFRRQRFSRTVLDALLVVAFFDPADGNVLPRRKLVAEEVLKNHADIIPQRTELILLQVAAIQQDTPFAGFIEPGQQLDQRGLAGTVLPDQGHLLPHRQFKGQIPDGVGLTIWVGKADVFELPPLLNILRKRDGTCVIRNTRPNGKEIE